MQTTSRYVLGNLAISVICRTVYGVTALLLGSRTRLRWR